MGINPKEMGIMVIVLCVELGGSGMLSVGWRVPGVKKETHL